ncbi:MAG: chorismate synthase [Patescibacteria group bacterium]
MPGNSFGQLFKITTAGESHGGAISVIIDGCPPQLKLSEADIQIELDRRRPGQSNITTARNESDTIHILSGVTDDQTTGTPILLLAYNEDHKSEDYNHLKQAVRPGHADLTYQQKYGLREWRGGGRASARETLARVAAGAIAKKYLREKLGVEILSYVEQVGDIKTNIDFNKVSLTEIESNIVRCPDQVTAKKMIQLIETVKAEGDSLGGVIRGVIKNVPAGLGEPVFDKLPADLGKAMLSINAVKGFEIGSGFAGVTLRGSEYNDKSNKQAGGTLGGISNGDDINFRVAFKPVATIGKIGRHDPCVLPRAVPIVDAMAALVIMDHYLRHKAQNL